MQTDMTFYVKTKVQVLGTEVEMYILLKSTETTSIKPLNSTELVTSNVIVEQKTNTGVLHSDNSPVNTGVLHSDNSPVNTGLLPVVSRAITLQNTVNTKSEKISGASRKRCSTTQLNAPRDFIELEFKNSVIRVRNTTLVEYAKEISEHFTTLPLKSLTTDLGQKITRIRKCWRENKLPHNIRQILDQTPNWSYVPRQKAKSTNIATNIKSKNDNSENESEEGDVDNNSEYLQEDDA